jgi:hypothetical protein
VVAPSLPRRRPGRRYRLTGRDRFLEGTCLPDETEGRPDRKRKIIKIFRFSDGEDFAVAEKGLFKSFRSRAVHQRNPAKIDKEAPTALTKVKVYFFHDPAGIRPLEVSSENPEVSVPIVKTLKMIFS